MSKVRKEIDWKTVTVKVGDIKPYEKNPRRIKDENFKQLERSLEKFNYVDLLILDTDMTIVGGHQRYKILSKNPEKEIEVRMPTKKLTTDDFLELNLRLNLNQGEFDFGSLQSRVNWNVDMLLDVGFAKYQIGAQNAEIQPPVIAPNVKASSTEVSLEDKDAYNADRDAALKEQIIGGDDNTEPMVMFEVLIPKSKREALTRKLNEIKQERGFEFLYEAFCDMCNI